MISAIAISLLITHLLVLSGILVWLFTRKRNYPRQPENFPKVSILIAARNEENNILSCLKAVQALNYPEDKYEVLIGNDQSTDRTQEIVSDFIRGKPNFKLLNIERDLGKAKGKANVLAHLAHHAKSDYFFITDADIRVQPEWIQALLTPLQSGAGVVSGTSIVRSHSLWGQLQEWEWLYLYTGNAFLDSFEPVTCSGNNMALSAQAYWATGGYENIEFSVTEDYQLYKELRKRGYLHRQLLEKEATAWSAPSPTLKDLMRQRKRWLTGGMDLPWYIWWLFGIYASFFPCWLALVIINYPLALGFLSLKVLIEFLLLQVSSYQCGFRLRTYILPFFEIYLVIINILTFFYFFIPAKVEWKGRKY